MPRVQRKPSTYHELYQALTDSEQARRQQCIDELHGVKSRLHELREQHRLTGRLKPEQLRECNRLATVERQLLTIINLER
ncbi:MAG: hypothetical protein KDK05_05825 [Candidatus Competibacteraceae bacterium]|nr:hypothetical protein [Candidatus Competibacteraceae bacterium]MCB1805213.1 hypothetical protein [Candidatus Competibacteraceae bacterium]